MSLESIANSVKRPIAIAVASVYLILNALGCNGNATPTPNPTQNPTPKPSPTQTHNPTPTPEPTPITTPAQSATPTLEDKVTPTITEMPKPNNSYDFGRSLGLEAEYLRNLLFDNTTREFITSLSELTPQMRAIAVDSGLVGKLITDNQVNVNETQYLKRLIEGYQKEIAALKPWLNQISEKEQLDALALNLSNFLKANQKDENGAVKMFYTLDGDTLPSLLPKDLFVADGMARKYAAEVKLGDAWGRTVKPYAFVMVDNITNFLEIQKKAWEVANNPIYDGFAINPLAKEHFRLEAVGSTDNGQNAYEDTKLLAQSGSPAAKAALRIYYWNLMEGRRGSAPQVRVELTAIDAWSIGIPSYEVVLAGHDVPTIPLTLGDIALLKGRASDPLLILEIDGSYHLPFQWTRKSILRKDVEVISIYSGTSGYHTKISDLKNY